MILRLRHRFGLSVLALAGLFLALILGGRPPAPAPEPPVAIAAASTPADTPAAEVERPRPRVSFAMPYFSFGKRSQGARS
jgi:hypothetical protein